MLTQAEARAHRVGSAGGVRARYLLAAGTADDAMWPLLQGKLQVRHYGGFFTVIIFFIDQSHVDCKQLEDRSRDMF